MKVFLYTRRSFERAVRAGVFGDRKVELLGGVPHVMSTNPPHVYVVRRLAGLLVVLFQPETYTIHAAQPVSLSGGWMPNPDISVVSSPADAYLDHLPTPGEVRLVVEVSDSTYAQDRGKKLKRYARAGIPEYWIVNIPDRFVQVFTGPRGDAYDHVAVFHEGERVQGLAVDDLLPPRGGAAQDG
jgi:Uma2 family endonuclease